MKKDKRRKDNTYGGSYLEFSDLRLRVYDLEQEVERLKEKDKKRAFINLDGLSHAAARYLFDMAPLPKAPDLDAESKSPDWNLAASLVSHTIVPSGPDGHLVQFTISVKRIPGMGVIGAS